MDWQFFPFCSGIAFLLCVTLTFYLKRNLGWVGAIRVSLLALGFFELLIVVSMFWASLEKSIPLLYQITLFLLLSISVLLMIYTAWQWSKFFLIFRKAGRISADISHTNYELGWAFGLMFLVGYLYLFYTSTIINSHFSILFITCLYLIKGARATQYRQNGIVYKGRFIPWNAIVSLSWKTEYSNERLNLHLKSSSEVLPLTLPFEQRKNILDFIQLKLPTQFMQANVPVPSIKTTNPLTNQSTSLNS